MPATASRLLWCVGIAVIVILLLCPHVHAQKDADKDQDGIPDLQDNCPYVVNQGQADNDKDGLGDACDTCPYEYGPASNNGCPEKAQPVEDDSDKDGLPNSQDNCPYDYGPVSNYGCPEKAQPVEDDSDKDGLLNSQDNCPYDYGPASNNGCPEKVQPVEDDSDKDGLPNSQDSCPYDYGPASNNGCPEKAQPVTEIDNDKDGVPDSQDNCPTVYNPDQAGSDRDSVGDACDKCPKDAGPASNSGCPVVTATTVPVPVVSLVVPRVSPVITPAPANPPGMVINVLTAFDPAGPGTSTVRARADAPGVPGLISVFVDDLQRRDCIGVRDCVAVVPDLNTGSNIGVLVLNSNNQAGTTGTVPVDAWVRPDLDRDDDGDGIPNYRDNCRTDQNPRQEDDADHDGVGDACDFCDAMRACGGTAGSMQTYACGNTVLTQFRTGNEYYHQTLYGFVSQKGCGCKDTDGYNYFTRGSVFTENVRTLPGFHTRCQASSDCLPAGTDFCIDSRTLNEMTCGPAGATNVTIRCPQGCRDGACECPDTDGGWNYYTAGDVDGAFDTCFDNYVLNEYACTYRNGMQQTSNRTTRCPYGCENGACQCGDSDGGLVENVKGRIGSASAGIEDSCMADGRTVKEYYSRLQNDICTVRNYTRQCEGRCQNGACQPPTCSDGITNQGELDIDCGGPCTRCGFVKVNGTLLYEEQDAGPEGTRLKPVRGVYVALLGFGLDKNIEDDEIQEGAPATTTDSRGHFEFVIPRGSGYPNGVALKFKPRNAMAEIEKDYDGYNEYVFFLTNTPVRIPATGEADFGKVIVPLRRQQSYTDDIHYALGYWFEGGFPQGPVTDIVEGSPYFNILEDIRVARTWADAHRGDDESITMAKVQYPDSVPVSRYNWKGEECIAGNAGFQDVTVLHEYGHQLEHDIGTLDLSWKIITDPGHNFCTVYDEEFAMHEGFPEWFGHMIVNRYRNDPQHWMSLSDTQFDRIESPDCFTNEFIEGGVIATMWDLIDTPGGEYYNASSAETWDTIGGAAYEDAAFKIWDIETDNIVDAPDICQFIWGTSGWKNWFSGRPEATRVDPILRANNITHSCDLNNWPSRYTP